MEMTVWRIEVRHLSFVQSERTKWSFLVATKGTSEKDAKALAESWYSPGWWKENIITDIVELGRLKAAEGLELPQEDLDY